MPRPKTAAAFYKPVMLRLPSDILEVLHYQASTIGRPLNTHMIFVLRRGLGIVTTPPTPPDQAASGDAGSVNADAV